MSARRNFLRDIALTIAASLVPRILQPAVPEVQEEEIDVHVSFTCYVLLDGQLMPVQKIHLPEEHIIRMKVETYEYFADFVNKNGAVGG